MLRRGQELLSAGHPGLQIFQLHPAPAVGLQVVLQSNLWQDTRVLLIVIQLSKDSK
eukprot:SAG22_NODE_1697_length_3790_cov_1.813601_3_plen_56_part_00